MSIEPRMVDVTVIETRIVPIPEPDWCVDPHDGANHFTDLTHNGTETAAVVDGIRFLNAWISHAPYLDGDTEPHPVVAIELDGASHDFHPDQVPGVTAALRARADELDALADQCAHLRGDHR